MNVENKRRLAASLDKLHKDERGISLVEVIAGLMIIGMIASILYGFMLMGITMYKKVTVETQLRNQANLLLGFVMDEMRDAIYAETVYKADGTHDPTKVLLVKRGEGSDTDVTKYVQEQTIEITNKQIISAGNQRRLTGDNMEMMGSFEVVSNRLVNITLSFTDRLDNSNSKIEEASLTINRKVPLFRIE